MTDFDWPALVLARLCNGAPRIAFVLSRPDGADRLLGSVAIGHLPALRAWPEAFELRARGDASPVLALRLAPAGRDSRLAEIHERLHAEGLIRGWRDEPYPLRDRGGGEHGTIERAASRFWGTLTLGAHCNGYVAGADGRPTHLWIARRAHTKPTDPGRLDNLVGGGVPLGQSAREAVIREGREEAGLEPWEMAGLVEGSVLELDCDVPEGRQHEHLHVFDLALPAARVPSNPDGEVAEHRCLPVAEAIARAAAGELTTDAALATLDFAFRHGLVDSRGAAGASLHAAFEALRVPAVESSQGSC